MGSGGWVGKQLTIHIFTCIYIQFFSFYYQLKKDEQSTHFLPVTAGGCNVIEWTAIFSSALLAPLGKMLSPAQGQEILLTIRNESSIWSSQTIEFQLLNSSQSSSCILQVLKSLIWTASILWILPNVIPKSDRQPSLSPWPDSLHLKAISTFKHYTVNQNLDYQAPHSETNECTASG